METNEKQVSEKRGIRLIWIIIAIIIIIAILILIKNREVENDNRTNVLQTNEIQQQVNENEENIIGEMVETEGNFYNQNENEIPNTETTNEIENSYNISYYENEKIEFDATKCENVLNGINQRVEIIDGKIKVTNINTNEEYVLNSISGAKNILKFEPNGVSEATFSYIILTEDGKIYYTSNVDAANAQKPSDFEALFTLLNTNYNFDKIGIAHDEISSKYIAMHTRDNKVVLLDEDFNEHMILEQ